MLMWARIAGHRHTTTTGHDVDADPVLYAKYFDLTVCFGMDVEEESKVIRMADDKLQGNWQEYKVMKAVGRSILDRLKQFHIEYMNITEEATHKFMEQYRLFSTKPKNTK